MVAAESRWLAAAEACARRLGGRLLELGDWLEATPPPVVVWWDEEGPALRGPPAGSAPRRPPPPGAVRPGRDPLLRALGKPIRGACVVDATAGWGADAGVIAVAGAHVLMIERSPVMALMLEEALKRWRAAGLEAALRMELRQADAAEALESVGSADVVYLDPLFPGRTEGGRRRTEGGGGRAERGTSAAELRWLRSVASWGATGVEAPLLAKARSVATRRVVVKRARTDPPLEGQRPSGSISGRTTRFDLYASTSEVAAVDEEPRAHVHAVDDDVGA